MSSKNNDVDTPTNVGGILLPEKPSRKSVLYLSPPNSPSRTGRVSGENACTIETICSPPLSPPATPPRQLPELTVNEKQATEKRAKATALRNSLGLTDDRCGASTKKKQPCKCLSPPANKTAVASQLESVIALTQSSTELKPKLDKLAGLVHCRYHDGGQPKEDRIEAWLKTFPMGVASIVDPETRIRGLLALRSTQCIGIADGIGSPCKDRIGGLRVHHCELTINAIVNSDVYLNDSYLEGMLRVLETSMRCPQHIKKQPLQRWPSWKSSIADFLADHPAKMSESAPLEETGESPVASDTPSCHEDNSIEKGAGRTSRGKKLLTPNFDRDLSSYWPVTYNISPFKIIEGSNMLSDSKSSYTKIKSEVKKPLEAIEKKAGYIYMYEVVGNPGLVKIGYTTRSVDERLQEWEFDCNRVPKVLYPVASSTAKAIPNARRVEALCHAELEHRRVRVYCHRCLKQHLEWFEISPTDAIAIIQKWSNWIATRPYESVGLRYRDKWTISVEEAKRTRDMNVFMDELAAAS